MRYLCQEIIISVNIAEVMKTTINQNVIMGAHKIKYSPQFL